MDIRKIIDDMLEDLALVASSQPNERLPKEEQIRCSIYTAGLTSCPRRTG